MIQQLLGVIDRQAIFKGKDQDGISSVFWIERIQRTDFQSPLCLCNTEMYTEAQQKHFISAWFSCPILNLIVNMKVASKVYIVDLPA